MSRQDPFAEFGGKAIATADPFAEFGGKPVAPPAAPPQETGVIAGAKRGLQNINPLNLIDLLKINKPLTVEDVPASNAAVEQAFQHMSEHPFANALKMIPIVGPFIGDLAERAPSDPAGTATEAAVTFGAPMLAAKALDAIPSRDRAAAKFDQVMAKAKDIPVDVTKAREVLERAQQLQSAGDRMPMVMTKFARATEEGQPALTYGPQGKQGGGRDFASKAGSLSAAEKQHISKTPMQAQVNEFAKAMKEANREAAAKVGMGELYDQAMKEYRQASSLTDAANVLKKWATRSAIFALGGAAGGAGYELWKSH